MKLRSKPKRPMQQKLSAHRDISSSDTLQELIDWAQSYNVPYNKIRIETNNSYDYDTYILKLEYQEPEEDYNRRLEQYRQKLIVWKRWYESNKEGVDAAIEARNHQKRERAEQYKRRELERLQKEKRQLEKRLEEVSRNLNSGA